MITACSLYTFSRVRTRLSNAQAYLFRTHLKRKSRKSGFFFFVLFTLLSSFFSLLFVPHATFSGEERREKREKNRWLCCAKLLFYEKFFIKRARLAGARTSPPAESAACLGYRTLHFRYKVRGTVFPRRAQLEVFFADGFPYILAILTSSGSFGPTLSTLRGSVRRGSDSPPGCHSLPRRALRYPRGEGLPPQSRITHTPIFLIFLLTNKKRNVII